MPINWILGHKPQQFLSGYMLSRSHLCKRTLNNKEARVETLNRTQNMIRNMLIQSISKKDLKHSKHSSKQSK